MPNHAQATIVGHLGRDPESSQAGEHNVTRFSVAVTRKRKAGDVTTWWNVTAWRQSAEYAAKYLKKGDAVMVVGEPYLDEYEKDGQKKQTLKMEATNVVSLASRKQEGDAPAAPVAESRRAVVEAAVSAAGGSNDDPPFNRHMPMSWG